MNNEFEVYESLLQGKKITNGYDIIGFKDNMIYSFKINGVVILSFHDFASWSIVESDS